MGKTKKNQMNTKTYSELITFNTFEERYLYLRLCGNVGVDTFGFDRVFNQMFYNRSKEWKSVRSYVISRDNGCDLGMAGYDIFTNVIVHHMNPITLDDIKNNTDILLNPEFLITTSHSTHNAIHYGKKEQIITRPVERYRNDTCPWKT